MTDGPVRFTVFTKRWKVPLPELGRLVAALGFWGIELPVRPGYPVEPEHVSTGLPEAAKILADCGVTIHSVAGPADEPTIAACAAAGVPILRVMAKIGEDGYLATEKRLRAEYDALVPRLDAHGVTLGVQNHCGRWVGSAIGLRRLIEPYDPRHVAAVYDAAHCALDGEEPAMAVDILWDRLCLVNLKNAFWQRTNGPESEAAEWRWYWTSSRQGLASWPAVAAELTARGYDRPICLTAEYTDHAASDRLLRDDLAYAAELFARKTGGSAQETEATAG